MRITTVAFALSKGRVFTTVEKLDDRAAEGRICLPPEGGWPRLIQYDDESKGRALGDVWEDIAPLNMRAAERLGYPTQKPEASSNTLFPRVPMKAMSCLIRFVAVARRHIRRYEVRHPADRQTGATFKKAPKAKGQTQKARRLGFD